ncbi:MAG: hypothetical protein ABGX07_07340, partial [Pirellulaceae bacterium]
MSSCFLECVALRLLFGVLVVGLAFSQEEASSQDQPAPVVLTVSAAEKLLQEKGSDLTDEELQLVCTATGLTDLDLSGCNRLSDKGLSHVVSLNQL